MRFSCLSCLLILITLGICGGVYAFSGFNLLYLLCFNSRIAYRIFLGIGFVAALYTVYAIFAFKPFKGLK